MSDIKPYKSTVKTPSDIFFRGFYVIAALTMLILIGDTIAFAVVHKNAVAFTALSGVVVLVLLLGVLSAVVGGILSAPEGKRELAERRAWIDTTYPGVFDVNQVRLLAADKSVYINDDGVNRDEAKFVYNQELGGGVVQFTAGSTPRLTPVATV